MRLESRHESSYSVRTATAQVSRRHVAQTAAIRDVCPSRPSRSRLAAAPRHERCERVLAARQRCVAKAVPGAGINDAGSGLKTREPATRGAAFAARWRSARARPTAIAVRCGHRSPAKAVTRGVEMCRAGANMQANGKTRCCALLSAVPHKPTGRRLSAPYLSSAATDFKGSERRNPHQQLRLPRGSLEESCTYGPLGHCLCYGPKMPQLLQNTP